jgi:hypothetical protein
MTDIQRQAWEQSMVKTYGSVEAGQAEMSRRSQLQKGIPKVTSGFANKDLAREAGKLGAQKRWAKVRAEKENN